MSLQHRLRSLIRVGAVVGGVTALSCGSALGLMIYDQNRVTGQYFKSINLAYQQVPNFTEMRTAVRQYEQTGEQDWVEIFRQAEKRDDQITAELQNYLGHQKSLLPLVEQVHHRSMQWRLRYGEPRITEAKIKGHTSVASPLSIEAVDAFNPVAQANEDLIAAIMHDRTQAISRLKYSTLLLGIMFALTLFAFALALLLLRRSLRVWVTKPLEDLAHEVERVSAGNLQYTVSGHGPVDIIDLGANIDKMRERIVAEYTAADKSRQIAEESRAVISRQSAELERSNRDLEQFAYVASHDLQEPLRKVSSFCQMLERRYHDQLDDRGRQYIDFAVDGAKRMQILINDLLAFSRVGRSGRGWEQVNTTDCLHTALQVLDDAIEHTGATITSDELPTITGDSTLLTQLFQNLVGNAVKFHGDNPPEVHVSATKVTDETSQAMWEFCCRDNGIGIAPQFQDKVFAIFQRLHSKEEYPGTGIGLALCKKIVEYHGGHMWLHVEPHPDVEDPTPGTTFCWTLPVAIPKPQQDPQQPDAVAALPPIHAQQVYPTPVSTPGAPATTVG